MKRHDAGESLTAYPIVDCVALGKNAEAAFERCITGLPSRSKERR
jgi:hypothetical protein